MNRFRFRFNSVLRYRELIEGEKKRLLGVATGHLHTEDEELARIDDTITDHESVREKDSVGSVSARDLQSGFNYTRSLDGKRIRQVDRVAKAENVVEKKRLDLVEATKQKKIFEKLKDREREVHEYELRKEEQSLIDDLSLRNKHAEDST